MRYAFNTVSHWTNPWNAPEAVSFSPEVELEELKEHFLISVDLPGVTKEDIKISADKGKLVISAERKEKASDAQTRFFTERRYGKFERTFDLGETVDTDRIDAAYRDGVLQVTLGKIEKAKPRLIQVREELAVEASPAKAETSEKPLH